MSETLQDSKTDENVDGVLADDVPATTGAADDAPVPATDENADDGDVEDGDVEGVRDVAEDDDAAEDDDEEDDGEDLLVQEGDVAGDYLERLLDLLDYDGDIDLDVEAGRALVSIDGGDDLEKLVGNRGQVLEALQELTRLAVQQSTGVRSRLMLDVSQWRADRRDELGEIGRNAARKALENGQPVRLNPMTPFERKVVHDAVATVEGVTSESEGEEPGRRVVVFASR